MDIINVGRVFLLSRTVLRELEDNFGGKRSTVVGLADVSLDTWGSFSVRDRSQSQSVPDPGEVALVVTNGFVPPPQGLRIDSVVGLGLPIVGREDTAKLMSSYCDYLDVLREEYGIAGRDDELWADLWVEVSCGPEICGLVDFADGEEGKRRATFGMARRFREIAENGGADVRDADRLRTERSRSRSGHRRNRSKSKSGSGSRRRRRSRSESRRRRRSHSTSRRGGSSRSRRGRSLPRSGRRRRRSRSSSSTTRRRRGSRSRSRKRTSRSPPNRSRRRNSSSPFGSSSRRVKVRARSRSRSPDFTIEANFADVSPPPASSPSTSTTRGSARLLRGKHCVEFVGIRGEIFRDDRRVKKELYSWVVTEIEQAQSRKNREKTRSIVVLVLGTSSSSALGQIVANFQVLHGPGGGGEM